MASRYLRPRRTLETVAARLARQYPKTNAGHGVSVKNTVDDLTFGSQQFLMMLMGAAIFVLLLACANVANLQLARASGRQKEIALRAALGASRWQVGRQLLVESVLLALLGSAAALARVGVGHQPFAPQPSPIYRRACCGTETLAT